MPTSSEAVKGCGTVQWDAGTYLVSYVRDLPETPREKPSQFQFCYALNEGTEVSYDNPVGADATLARRHSSFHRIPPVRQVKVSFPYCPRCSPALRRRRACGNFWRGLSAEGQPRGSRTSVERRWLQLEPRRNKFWGDSQHIDDASCQLARADMTAMDTFHVVVLPSTYHAWPERSKTGTKRIGGVIICVYEVVTMRR